jgi:hypothetical protein
MTHNFSRNFPSYTDFRLFHMEYIMKTLNTALIQFTFMLSMCAVIILNNIYPILFKIHPYGIIAGFIGGGIIMTNVLFSKTINHPMTKTWLFCLSHSLIISSLFNRHNDFAIFGKSIIVFLFVLMFILLVLSKTIDKNYNLKPLNKNIININLIIYALVRFTYNTRSEIFHILDIVFLILLVLVMVCDLTYFFGKSGDVIYSGSKNSQNKLFVNQSIDIFIVFTHIFIRICTIIEYY